MAARAQAMSVAALGPEGHDNALVHWSEGEWSFLALPAHTAALSALVRRVALAEVPAQYETHRGGRGVVVVAPFGTGGRVVVRPYRRGGWMRLVNEKTYWGVSPRSFRELECLVALKQRGVPVVEPVGAAVRWRGWWSYEAWLVTRYVEQSQTLWSWFASDPGGEHRRAGLDAVARAVAELHRAGAYHPDLNLQNILVRSAGGAVEAWLVDLDGAIIRSSRTDARRSLARMRRSARKLDPAARYITPEDWRCLEAAVQKYWNE